MAMTKGCGIALIKDNKILLGQEERGEELNFGLLLEGL